MVASSNGVTPKWSILDGDFPWNKPSIGVPPILEAPISLCLYRPPLTIHLVIPSMESAPVVAWRAIASLQLRQFVGGLSEGAGRSKLEPCPMAKLGCIFWKIICIEKANTRKHTHTCMWVCMYACMYEWKKEKWMYVCMYEHMYGWMYVRTYVYMCVYMCI